jgi:hypothetical protein
MYEQPPRLLLSRFYFVSINLPSVVMVATAYSIAVGNLGAQVAHVGPIILGEDTPH